MDTSKKHPNHTEPKADNSIVEVTAQSGTNSTGASSHVDPLAKNLINANPASDKKGILHPAYSDQSGSAWLRGVTQLPQQLQEWGSKAAAEVGGLSITQKVVGGTLLAGSLGWLILGASKKKAAHSRSGKKSKKHGKGKKGRTSKRPWGTADRTPVAE